MKLLKSCFTVFCMCVLFSCSKDDEAPKLLIPNTIPDNVIISIDNFEVTIPENPEVNQILGVINASVDLGTLSFSLSNQVPANAMSIDADTGELKVADNMLFDYEENTTITARVTAWGNNNVAKNANVTINIEDVFEVKTFEGNIELTNQNELDEFAQERYTHITGSLIIAEDVLSLEPLSTLVEVGSLIVAYNSELINLSGLENIESINGPLIIEFNDGLEYINGLSGVNSVNGNVYISANFDLISIDGLQNVSNINGYLTINYHPQLLHINGLQSLETIGGNFIFDSNEAVPNLDFLQNLNEINGSIGIYGNNLLNNYCGLNTVIINNSFNSEYVVFANGYNPTIVDLQQGNCSL